MPDMTTLFLFSGAALLLLLIPGPAVLYIVAPSASQGTRAGLVSTVGIHAGTLVHVAAAVVGLSAILVASANAFTIVKLAGAAYLLYLGVAALRSARASSKNSTHDLADRPLGRLFIDGAVVNILNPKTAVFFLAFVPQFIDPAQGSATLQLLVLSGVFVFLGLITDSLFALSGGWVGERMKHSPTFARRKDTLAGVSYLSLGVVTAVGARP